MFINNKELKERILNTKVNENLIWNICLNCLEWQEFDITKKPIVCVNCEKTMEIDNDQIT